MNIGMRLRAAARNGRMLPTEIALLWSTILLLATPESVWAWAARLLFLPWIYAPFPGAAWVRAFLFPTVCGVQVLRFPQSGILETFVVSASCAAYFGVLLQPPETGATPVSSVTRLAGTPEPSTAARFLPAAFALWVLLLSGIAALWGRGALGLLFAGAFSLVHFPHWWQAARRNRRSLAVIGFGTGLYFLAWATAHPKLQAGAWTALLVWMFGVGFVRPRPARDARPQDASLPEGSGN